MRWRLLLAAGLAGLLSSSTVHAAPTAQINLRLSYGGALVLGQLRAPAGDILTGLWSSQGRARLLHCQPRCQAAKTIAVPGRLSLSDQSAYRAVLGGLFKEGQRVVLTFRFASGAVINVQATVRR